MTASDPTRYKGEGRQARPASLAESLVDSGSAVGAVRAQLEFKAGSPGEMGNEGMRAGINSDA
jgi:hypothetical protein